MCYVYKQDICPVRPSIRLPSRFVCRLLWQPAASLCTRIRRSISLSQAVCCSSDVAAVAFIAVVVVVGGGIEGHSTSRPSVRPSVPPLIRQTEGQS